MKYKNKFFFSLILTSLFFISAAKAFSISPLKYFYTLAPGDKQDIVVTVKNDSDQAKDFLMSVTGLKQDALGRSVFADNIDLAENWFSNKNKLVTIAPHTSKDLIFNLSIPKNSPPGAHYLGVGAQEKNNGSIGGKLLTLVVFQVSGLAQENLVLEKFYPSRKYFFDKNWLGIFQVKNVGNVDLALGGQVKIIDPADNIFTTSLNFGNKLFSQSERSLNIIFPDSSKWLWPGRYHAQVEVVYGLTKQSLMASTEFWYCPKWLLISGGAILLLILLLLIFKKVKNEVAV